MTTGAAHGWRCHRVSGSKVHQPLHYIQSIRLFGAADGFNTELPDHLHIDFAKSLDSCPIFWQLSYLDWLSLQSQANSTEGECDYDSDLDAENEDLVDSDLAPAVSSAWEIVHILAKTPMHPRQSIQHIETIHGATDFLLALKSFLYNHLPHNHIVPGPQDHFDVFCQVIIISPPNSRVSESLKRLCVRVTPEVVPSASGRKPGSPARFNMALVTDGIWASRLRSLDGM
ncbi:uncharacterized protein EDB91DRAFT_1054788 [Suillus paluster]|uniref:uncharacterized protein n=1 Tax=Suillus paluster TaxID=48578 RepID=UPI001B865811|nr:uncharacterized protein EDB91DRAFT_1054788 [Suillus paluster]KAG1738090.1 hypothetical protein EDB91DRAFT_1054788 [Suillus paluster]